ncbi:glycosyltransferase family 39 protein [Rhizorhabdus sp.]|uniref:glycosyltransferase family 39 protein n=1 Tax=Rhizorhabdus sp. TaxID=1968843 RepID=UPI0035AF263F
MTGVDRRPPAGRAAWLALLLALAAATRFNGLTANAMWADELFSWRLTTLAVSQILPIVAGDVHPPLYFLMLKLITSLLGDSLTVLRGFSAIPSVLSCGLLFLFLDRRAGRPFAVAAALILIASPASIHYAQQIRGYALCEFFAVAVVVALFRYVERPRAGRLAQFFLCCITLDYLHFIGPFVLAGLFALALWLFVTGRIARRELVAVVGIMGLATACLVPWLWMLLARSQVVGSQMHVFDGLSGVVEAVKVFVKLLGGFVAVGPALLLWAAGLAWRAPARPLLRLADSGHRTVDLLIVGHVMALIPFALFALMGVLGGPFIRLHPAIVASPWLAVMLAACLSSLPSRPQRLIGAIFGIALAFSALTIPYRLDQVPIPAVLDVAAKEHVRTIITYGEEMALTQRFLGRSDVRIIDLRAIPAGLCGGRVAVEIMPRDAAYDPVRHSVTYGLMAPGGQRQSFALPPALRLVGEKRFPISNMWKPGVVEAYRLLLFDAPGCRLSAAGA